MKVHAHIKKLFDAQNRWLQHEKKVAKRNERKARTNTPNPFPFSLRHRLYTIYGFIWWRGSRKRGMKNAQGQMLPQNQGDIQE